MAICTWAWPTVEHDPLIILAHRPETGEGDRSLAQDESRTLTDGEGSKTLARARRGVEELDLVIEGGGGSP
jgi:hypothetical protein